MPIYEYECKVCGHRLEALQKFSDAPLTDCPACGKVELRKLISAAGFQLKGSGWYVTDFKNSGKKPAAKDDKKADGDKVSTGTDGADKSKADGDKPASSGEKAKTETGGESSGSSSAASGDA